MVVYDRVLPNQADQSLYALAFGVGVAIIFDQFFKAARGGILEQSAVYKDKKSNDDIFEQFVETKTDLTKRSIGSLSTVSRDYETYKEFVVIGGSYFVHRSALYFCICFRHLLHRGCTIFSTACGGPSRFGGNIYYPALFIQNIKTRFPG